MKPIPNHDGNLAWQVAKIVKAEVLTERGFGDVAITGNMRDFGSVFATHPAAVSMNLFSRRPIIRIYHWTVRFRHSPETTGS